LNKRNNIHIAIRRKKIKKEMSNNNIVNIEYNRVTNVTSTDFPSYSQSNSGMTVWETEKFKNTLDIEITQ